MSGSVFRGSKSTDALSSFWCSTYCSSLPLSPSPTFTPRPVFSSSVLSCTLSCRSCTRSLPPPLLAALHVFGKQHRLPPVIGSFLLALPLHHSLIGLSHFQCPAHSAAHGNRISRPHHESFINQCLFSALIGECWVQSAEGEQQYWTPAENRTRWLDSNHSYQFILVVYPAVFFLYYIWR